MLNQIARILESIFYCDSYPNRYHASVAAFIGDALWRE